jgi:hypothetical protein
MAFWSSYCRAVVLADRFPINSPSFSPAAFGSRTCLCGISPQEVSVPFDPHARLHARCTGLLRLSLSGSRLEIAVSLSLEAIAESGFSCPVGVNQYLSTLGLRGWPHACFHFHSRTPAVRSDIDQSFPRGHRIEHGDTKTVGAHDKLFNHGTRICIPRNAEVLLKSCFADSKLKSITCESESRLTRIEESGLFNCSLTSICIPRNVEILPNSYVADSKLESITFESKLRLTRIEEPCF